METLREQYVPSATESYFAGFREVIRAGWPASLTMLNSTIIAFTDGLMVSRVNAVSLNAQFAAGISSFVFEAFFVGVLGIVNTFVSQNYGSRRYDMTSQYVHAGMAISVMASLLFAPLAFFPEPFFRLMSSDYADAGQFVSLATMYFRYMMLTLVLRLLTTVLCQFFYGVQRQRVVLLASMLAMVVNVVGNYIFIFGHLGFRPMGLEGAAWGSVLAFASQFVLLGAIFLSGNYNRLYQTRRHWRISWKCVRDIMSVGWPAGVQFFSDIFCWMIFTGFLVGKKFGPEHLTGTVIAMRYMNVSFMPAIGIGIATTSLVGKYIGAKRPELVRRRARQGCMLAVVYMGVCGLLFWIFGRQMAEFYVQQDVLAGGATAGNAEAVINISRRLLMCAAAFQIFDGIGIVYSGALQGAGDTWWKMLCAIILTWVILIGGGYLVSEFLPQLASTGPWLAAAVFVMCLCRVDVRRFESGAWKKFNLLGPQEDAAVEALSEAPPVV